MNIYLRGDIWWIDAAVGKGRVRRSLKTTDREEAEAKAKALVETTDFSPDVPDEIMNALMTKRFHAAMGRSKTKGHEFHLSRDEVSALFARANGRCEVTGVAFSTIKLPGHDKAPFTPTLDRIDNRKPYRFENCRVVCLAANIAMNEWGEWVFKKMVDGYLTKIASRPPRRVMTQIGHMDIPSYTNQQVTALPSPS